MSRGMYAQAGPPGDTGSSPEALWEGYAGDRLALSWSLPRVSVHAWVGSTNDVARDLARAGAPSGTLVIADEQRAGRGRGGRSWSSPAGVGLWCSMILRELTAQALATLPIRVALAVGSALDRWTDRPVLVKWPNDLLIEGGVAADGVGGEGAVPTLKKVAGILCESAWESGAPRYAIVGIGINILQKEEDFPPEIGTYATSLRLASAREPSRLEVATTVVQGLRPLVVEGQGGAGDLPRLLAARDALRDRLIEIVEPDHGRLIARGRGKGIDGEGSLLIESVDGVVAVRSGTVRWVEA